MKSSGNDLTLKSIQIDRYRTQGAAKVLVTRSVWVTQFPSTLVMVPLQHQSVPAICDSNFIKLLIRMTGMCTFKFLTLHLVNLFCSIHSLLDYNLGTRQVLITNFSSCQCFTKSKQQSYLDHVMVILQHKNKLYIFAWKDSPFSLFCLFVPLELQSLWYIQVNKKRSIYRIRPTGDHLVKNV